MAIGEARALHKRTKQKVVIVDRMGRPVKSELFHGIPYLQQGPTSAATPQRLVNGSGVRPYIAGKTETRWTWRKYKPIPGEIVFSQKELEFAEPYRGSVMIEPNNKAIGHDNKAWLCIYWQHVANEKKIPWVQCAPSGSRFLQNVKPVVTESFRHAAAVLSVCRAFVGTEGGLMHAAAAVGVPAVIIWSEFISPEITGYPQNKNLRKAGAPCGMRVNCPTCHESLVAIKPAEVVAALKEILG